MRNLNPAAIKQLPLWFNFSLAETHTLVFRPRPCGSMWLLIPSPHPTWQNPNFCSVLMSRLLHYELV